MFENDALSSQYFNPTIELVNIRSPSYEPLQYTLLFLTALLAGQKKNVFDLRNFYGAGIFEYILESQTLENFERNLDEVGTVVDSNATGILKMCVLWKV